MRLRLVLEYDGSSFHGWQWQGDVSSVQQSLTEALLTVAPPPAGAPPYVVVGASRTDAGVHARGQVAHVRGVADLDLVRLRRAISGYLRNRVAVRHLDWCGDEFHARRDALEKEYRYRLFIADNPPVLDRHRVWFLAPRLNLERLHREAAACEGSHDFTSCRAAQCSADSPVRSISRCYVEGSPPFVTIVFRGRSFLKQMVRILVGTMVRTARGEGPGIEEVLAARTRAAAGLTAPAEGLTLEWIRYAHFHSRWWESSPPERSDNLFSHNKEHLGDTEDAIPPSTSDDDE